MYAKLITTHTPQMISNHSILNIFGENVRFFRKKQKISQEELAFKSGLHKNFIGMVERAERTATIISLEKIALALGVRYDDLLISREKKDETAQGHINNNRKKSGYAGNSTELDGGNS